MKQENPLSILFTWLDWRRIDHPVVKKINQKIPLIFGILSGIIVYFLPINLNIFGQNGIVSQTNGLLQILTGFFIASLAAVATFQRTELDDVMQGNPPKLPINSGYQFEELTRRRFLCLLFGYLSGISIFLYIFGSLATILAPVFQFLVTGSYIYHIISRVLFSTLYCSILGNLLVTTFLGLYFLVDRIHQDSPKIGFSNDPSTDDENN